MLNDIAYDIMRLETIQRFRDELDRLWDCCANVHVGELISIAESLGRKKKKKKGGHLSYISDLLGRPPLIISHHPGARDIGAVKDTIKLLHGDLDVLEEMERQRLQKHMKGDGHA